MSLFGGLTESRREINWHEFKYQLLEQKMVPPSRSPALPEHCDMQVDRVEVVNGTRVNVYLKMSSALGLGAGGMQQGAQVHILDCSLIRVFISLIVLNAGCEPILLLHRVDRRL